LSFASDRCETIAMADWSTAFEVLVNEHRATVRTRDGVCALTFDCVLTTSRNVLACVPGEWTLIEHEERELIDFTGSPVDVELTYELWACDGERAIFTCVDHWQAGLLGTLCIYATSALYQDALRSRASHTDTESSQTDRRQGSEGSRRR
jgi:hypothetical protein